MALHLAAPGQPGRRLRRAVPARVRGRSHLRACTCCACARRSATTTAPTPWPGSTRRWGGGSSTPPDGPPAHARPAPALVAADALAELALPAPLLGALDDAGRDAAIQAEGDEALALTGKDVGTPILHIAPPEGAAFFGPVISRMPTPEQAGELWDHVVGLATFPGFAELKRSLRERPQLASFGLDEAAVGVQEDWHGGSRRQRR